MYAPHKGTRHQLSSTNSLQLQRTRSKLHTHIKRSEGRSSHHTQPRPPPAPPLRPNTGPGLPGRYMNMGSPFFSEP